MERNLNGDKMKEKRIGNDEMKAIELDIMRELYRVCHEEGLKCIMAYGTLLGAIRHHGFIPWDDDIDLIMPREDYERLPEAFAKLSSKPYYKIIWYRDRSSIYPFIKVVDTRTEVIEHYVDERWCRTGVWVDVFPADGMAQAQVRLPNGQHSRGLLDREPLGEARAQSHHAQGGHLPDCPAVR